MVIDSLFVNAFWYSEFKMGDHKISMNIQVFCRVRPPTDSETIEKGKEDISFPNEESIRLPSGKVYSFDRILPPECSQNDVYNKTAKSAIKDVLNGYNATIFAYGPTSSGKTFTMEGNLKDKDDMGIIPRIGSDIFHQIHSSENISEIKVSFVEIYLEKIRDLLDKTNKESLSVYESKDKPPFISGVKEVIVKNHDEFLKQLEKGCSNRVVSATDLNERSSRSHSIMQVVIQQENPETQQKLTGKLLLVDLAGSEVLSNTESTIFKETKYINKSLSQLAHVICELSKRSKHIPYRNSILTRLLKESLGGNAKTIIIICVSPNSLTQTKCSLEFGSRAKVVRNSISVNEKKNHNKWKAMYEKASSSLKSLQSYVLELEHEIKRRRNGEVLTEQEWVQLSVAKDSSSSYCYAPENSFLSVFNQSSISVADDSEEVVKLRTQVESLERQIDDLQIQQVSHLAEQENIWVKYIEKERLTAEQARKNLTQNLEKLTAEIERLKILHNTSEEELSRVKEELSVRLLKESSNQKSLENYTLEIGLLKEANHKLRYELEDEITKCRIYKVNCEELSYTESELKNLKESNLNRNKEVEQLRKENIQCRIRYDEELEKVKLQSKTTELANKKEFKSLLAQIQLELKNMKESNLDKNKEIERLKKEKNECRKCYDEELGKLKVQMESNELANKREFNNLFAQTQSEIKNLKESNLDKNKEIERLKKENSDSRKRYDEELGKIKVQMESNELANKREFSNLLAQTQSETKNLKEGNLDKNKEIERLKKENSECRKRCDEELGKVKVQMESLLTQSEKENLKEIILDKSKEIKRLIKEYCTECRKHYDEELKKVKVQMESLLAQTQSEKDNLKESILDKNKEIERLIKENSECRKHCDEELGKVKVQMESNELANEREFNNLLAQTQSEIKNLKESNLDKNKEIERLKKENSECRKRCDEELGKVKVQMESLLAQTQSEKENLKESNLDKNKEIERLRKENDELMKRHFEELGKVNLQLELNELANERKLNNLLKENKKLQEENNFLRKLHFVPK